MTGERRPAQLAILDRLFPLLILVSMAVGLTFGRLAPTAAEVLEPLIPLGLFLMIYPTVSKVPLGEIRRAAAEKRPTALSIFLNYLINPLLLWSFGWLFLRGHPDLWTGMVLLGIAPCIGMVLVWADLGGANNPLSVALMAWNSLIQIVSVPFWIFLLVGSRVPVEASLVLRSVLLYLLLPIVLGTLTRRIIIGSKGETWFKARAVPLLGKVQLSALLGTLVLMFALKGHAIIEHPDLVAYMALPLSLFFFTLFSVGYTSSRLLGLGGDRAVTVGFHVTGRNFELSIALALSAFAATPLVAVSTVIGPLIEVPTMLALVALARWLAVRQTPPALQGFRVPRWLVANLRPGGSALSVIKCAPDECRGISRVAVARTPDGASVDSWKDRASLLRHVRDDTALRILNLLSQEETCVCELVEGVGARPSAVGRRLLALQENGLIASRSEGHFVLYRLKGE